MAGIEEETITTLKSHVLGIIFKVLAKKHINEVGATHGTTRMSALSLLDGSCGKDTDIVRSLIHQSD